MTLNAFGPHLDFKSFPSSPLPGTFPQDRLLAEIPFSLPFRASTRHFFIKVTFWIVDLLGSLLSFSSFSRNYSSIKSGLFFPKRPVSPTTPCEKGSRIAFRWSLSFSSLPLLAGDIASPLFLFPGCTLGTNYTPVLTRASLFFPFPFSPTSLFFKVIPFPFFAQLFSSFLRNYRSC